jgi:hypothetical protein
MRVRELLPRSCKEDLKLPVTLYHELDMVATFEPQRDTCSFKLYLVTRVDLAGIPYFRNSKARRQDCTEPGDDLTADISQAEIFAAGGVNAEGCANWKFFPDMDNGIIHTCGFEYLTVIGLSLLCAWRDCMRRIAVHHQISRNLLHVQELEHLT